MLRISQIGFGLLFASFDDPIVEPASAQKCAQIYSYRVIRYFRISIADVATSICATGCVAGGTYVHGIPLPPIVGDMKVVRRSEIDFVILHTAGGKLASVSHAPGGTPALSDAARSFAPLVTLH